jgi:hypothetical protein
MWSVNVSPNFSNHSLLVPCIEPYFEHCTGKVHNRILQFQIPQRSLLIPFRIPLNFAPLRLLSFSSVVGIFSCFCSEYIILVHINYPAWSFSIVNWAYNRSSSFSIALCFSIFHPPPKYICFA